MIQLLYVCLVKVIHADETTLKVIDTKERLYDLSFEWEKIRIGDIWWGSKLIKGSYLIKKVGNIYVVYSKD